MDRNNGEDLVRRAAAMGSSSAYISNDLAASLFPKSDVQITDRMLSFAQLYLRAIIAEVETQICLIATQNFGVSHESVMAIGNSDQEHCYPVLRSAGLLETRAILDHVFVRALQAELNARLLQKISQENLEKTMTRHLDDEEPAIGQAAMALLVAHSRANANTAHISDLSADMLHELVWSVVAAIEKVSGYAGKGLTDAAQQLLGDHDESGSVSSRALRLAQLLDQADENSDQLSHPLVDGPHLFFAKLARRSALPIELITVFTAEPNMARLVVLLRALDFSSEDALSIFAALDNGGILTAASYNEIGKEDARELVQSWSMNAVYRQANIALSGFGRGPAD